MYTIEQDSFLKIAQDTYNAIKDNPDIPKELKDSWTRACVNNCNINMLGN